MAVTTVNDTREWIEIYPDVTSDPETWPVLCRFTAPDGREVVVHDPAPHTAKITQRIARLQQGCGPFPAMVAPVIFVDPSLAV